MENLRFLAPFDERFHKSKDPVIISSTGSTRSVPEYVSSTNRKNVSLKTQLLFDNWNNFKDRWARVVLKRCSSERGEREKRFYGDGKCELRRIAF